ncbi:MAG: hypothetical protein WKF89_18640 [Chitinophagaceae bacterium]
MRKEQITMNKKSVLVVSNSRRKENLLNAWTYDVHTFHIDIVDNDEAAIELFHKQRFDMVVVDGTDSSIDERKLHAVLPILQEDVTVLGYRGESASELENNVKAIFDAKKYQRIQRLLMLEPSINILPNLPAFSLN